MNIAGQAKVVKTELTSIVRRELSTLSDTNSTNITILADIEPIYLPKILKIIAEEHGLKELCVMLVTAVVEFESVVGSSSHDTCWKQKRKKKGYRKVNRRHM